ncbi:protocadherin-10-like [Clavelina lepadiformis]|uniref:protocadherin-10-like n=1 Tax=Clavelina lepadiformis TaxID=159417 RepID=UPI0040428186
MPEFKGPSLFFIATIITSLHTELSIASSTVSTTIYLRENTAVGTTVAELATILGMSIDPRSGRKFQILSQKLDVSDVRMPHRNHNWLSLDENTGRIILRCKLDREEICPTSKLCSIKLTVYVKRISRIVTFDVEIIDVNEHAPIFPVKYILINVSEDAQIGDVISLDRYRAYDKDAGNNSLIKYSLTPNRYFILTQFVDERRTQHLQIEIRSSLDYEREPLHRLQLIAMDKADQPLSSNVSLQIRIVDENDNNPVFEQAEYSVVIPEDTKPGEQIIRVQAHDIDAGLAGTVRYYLSSLNKKTTFDLLNVNELTGDVSLASRLDWESLTRLVAFIEARDLGKEQRTGSTQLVINVVDVNDNKPIINVNFISSSFNDNTVYISELANKSYRFAYVSAKDKDFELNGETVLSIRTSLPETDQQDGLTQNVANTFALNANGVLILNQSLDITKHDRYDIFITACDKGLEKVCSNSTINVVILDENNNSPKFDQPTENITISENTTVGSTIMTMRATDDDTIVPSALKKNQEDRIVTSTNGVITYSLLNGDGTFAIGPKTGVITLVRPLDREHVSEWKVVVEASDGGKPKSLKGRCVINILISDVNDNAPIFVNPVNDGATFHSTILKDAVITRVHAVDYDKGKNAKLKYKILYEDGVRQTMHIKSSLFVLDSTNGDMRLNKSNSMLNQSLGSHDLVIMVSDAGVPPLTSKKQIQVVITDDLFIPSSSPSPPGKGPQFPTTLVIIIGAVSAALLLLILVVVIVVIKCKKENKACFASGHHD